MENGRYWGAASGYSMAGADDLLFFSFDERGNMRDECRFQVGGNPSFLCKDGDTLYAGLEMPDRAVVLSFLVTVDGGGKLEKTGELEVDASGLCHVSVGRHAVYGCCYGSGHVFAVDKELRHVLWKECPDRKQGISPHAHCGMETDDGRFLVEADLGMDAVYGFPLSDGILAGERVVLAKCPGAGPRQVLYEKSADQFIVVGEQGNTVAGYEWTCGDGQSQTTWMEKWSLGATDRTGANYPGGASSTEDGIVFWGNRGADTIAAVKNGKTAAFLGEWACRGSWPRSVLASGGCVFAACQKSGTLESFVWNGRMLEQSDCLKLEEAACVIAWQME